MKIYIDNDFNILLYVRNPAWIFKKLPCLTRFPHGVECISTVPFISMRPYIEINDLRQLFKLANDLNNMNNDYMLIVEPYGSLRIVEKEILYDMDE